MSLLAIFAGVLVLIGVVCYWFWRGLERFVRTYQAMDGHDPGSG